MSMRAALFYGPEEGLKISECPRPQIRGGDLLVKIAAAGLCHSDLGTLVGQPPPKHAYPIIPGHEASGIVEAVGADVTRFKVGDKVGFLMFYGNCGDCLQCAANPVFCPEGELQGFTGNGYFAEYAAVDERSATIVPDELDLIQSAPLFCAGLTAFHAVDQTELKAGEWLGVVGIGGLGHLGVQYAVKMGYKVAALDIDPQKLTLAKELGASEVFDSRASGALDDLKLKSKGGVAAAICFSGSDKAYESAVAILRPGGTLMAVGITRNPLPIYSIALCNGLIKVKGASSGLPGPMMEKAMKFTVEHGITSHVTRHSLDELPQMVEKLKAGTASARMVVVF